MKIRSYLAIAAFFCTGYKTMAQSNEVIDFNSIHNTFVHIPDSIQTSVYWYWISGNVSKEGVVKDLEAMKKVGINRAFIGMIGLDNVPDGKAKMFSDDWWDILHTALKTATLLNIQIGIFNGPGWSQSGGPWIKPGESMRYLTSSEIMLKGPVAFHKKLTIPQADFQDVKVLAYPVPAGYNSSISTFKPALSSEPAIDSIHNIMDDNRATAIHLKQGQQYLINIDSKTPYTVNSIIINTTSQAVTLEGDIEAKINNVYTVLKHFSIDRSNPALNTGFIPFGPAALSIPATKANNFRIRFTKISSDAGITELKLSSTPVVENYIEKTLAKMWPTPHPFWDTYQWPQQPATTSKYIIDPAAVIDISKYLEPGGTLNWKVPAGNWIIERTGMLSTYVTNTPAPAEGRGLEVDKMSREHVTDHFNAFLGEILRRIPAEDRKSFKVAVEDSYETGGQNWTDSLIPEFKHMFHYDPTSFMPVLQGRVIGSEDRSDRFLWDLRRLIANNVSFKYVGGLADISHANGLTTWLENYGHWGYPGEFLQYGGQSDEVGGEFWSEGDLGDIENRAAASSAHIYGKTKVSAESFTAGGAPFARYPANFKKRGDRFFTEGINNTLLHVYVSQPQDSGPGLNAWFGVEFNRHNTWFNDMNIWLQYLKRCNFMLQEGRYSADVAYFIGEDAPKMTGITNPPLPPGYSFDYINSDVILQRLTVSSGRLVLPNGISYGILVLPQLETMRPELLTRIKEMVQQGAVVLGPRPLRSPSLENYPLADKQVQNMANELWGKINGSTIRINHYGKGSVLSGMSMQEALDIIQLLPDLSFTQSDSLLFIHREMPGGSIYFISNQKNTAVKFTAAFRITGKSPELWNATDGSTRDLPNYIQSNTTTSVPLELAPLESVFIIFRKDAGTGDTTQTNYSAVRRIFNINKPWMVDFDSLARGPVNPALFDSLADWSQHPNDSIKYYSGTAYYHTTFTIDSINKASKYIIDLGIAKAIARVSVNGMEMGGVWTAPYQVDITAGLKPGINALDIKVVNTWVNRLMGDNKLPPEKRKTSVLFGPDPNGALQSSGLLGPVVVKEER